MGRPKLKEKDKKIKLSITLSKEISRTLDYKTSNKSKFIEELLKKELYNGNK